VPPGSAPEGTSAEVQANLLAGIALCAGMSERLSRDAEPTFDVVMQ
jgi:hypothetical protein